MPNLNMIQLIGHVGKEPEGISVGKSMVYKFSVAVSRGKNKETQQEYGTDWFRIECWNQDWIPDIIHQGDLVYVQGRMEIDQKDEKTYTSVRAFRVFKLRAKLNSQTETKEAPLENDEVIPIEGYETDEVIPIENDQPPF
ncbi:MAG: single-stranded DNA-binding protein [Petrotogales bacterium]